MQDTYKCIIEDGEQCPRCKKLSVIYATFLNKYRCTNCDYDSEDLQKMYLES